MAELKESQRHLALWAAALLLLEAGALGAIGHPALYPVTFGADVLVQVDISLGVVVLVVLAAIARLLPVRPVFRWIEFSLTASITVFLVAQLNAITDVGALVLAYAATSGMVLFAVLQDRVVVRSGHPLLPLCFGAALGIVSWGVIAFHQIGASLLGPGPSVMVRVITLVMLTAAFAFFVSQWRAARRGHGGERMHVLLTVASVSAFGWLVVLGLG